MPIRQIMKIWWRTDDSREMIVAKLEHHFAEVGPGVTFVLYSEDEGRRVSGWIAMQHPRWEDFYERGLLIPTHSMLGCEN